MLAARSRVSQRKALAHPAGVVYHTIADIAAYPQFLPWCRRTSIESRQPAASLSRSQVVPAGAWAERLDCLVDFNFGQFAGIPPCAPRLLPGSASAPS